MALSEHPRRIAVYLPATADYSRRLAAGVRRYCQEHEDLVWRVFWYAPEMGYVDASHGPPPWSNWKPHGLIVFACQAEVDVQWLTSGVPFVVATTSDVAPETMPVVHIDRRAAARLALRHFLDVERKHFAYVGLQGYPGSQRGREQFAAELAPRRLSLLHYDLAANPAEGLDSLQDRAGNEPGLLAFLRAAPKPLGVLADTDAVARAVCDACFTLGLSVPADVAVVGLGNTVVAESSVPTLSSIDTPGDQVGFEAMALLDRLLQGEKRPRQAVLVPPTELVARESTVGRRHNPDVERALHLIREQLGQRITVTDLARLLSVSRSHLEQEFVRVLGRAPGEEIRRLRIERAKELLRTSAGSVTEIAGLLGFERSCNFSEFFRKYTGMTPSAYRQAERKR